MSKHRDQVAEFHRVFEHPTASTPTVLSSERMKFRLMLIAEEFVELVFALGIKGMFASPEKAMESLRRGLAEQTLNDVDLVEVVDALADLDYVVEGFRLELGVDGGPIADEVHRSNMAKLHNGVVKKRADGKTLKPADWTPPNIAGELRRQGWKGK